MGSKQPIVLQGPSIRRSLRVLLVEDNAADAELAVVELTRAGFDPTWRRVQDEAGYTAALDEPFDVILADRNLPQFSAGRALEILNARGRDVPLIVVSGAIPDEERIALLGEGAAETLPKDDLAELGSLVARVLDRRVQGAV